MRALMRALMLLESRRLPQPADNGLQGHLRETHAIDLTAIYVHNMGIRSRTDAGHPHANQALNHDRQNARAGMLTHVMASDGDRGTATLCATTLSGMRRMTSLL